MTGKISFFVLLYIRGPWLAKKEKKIHEEKRSYLLHDKAETENEFSKQLISRDEFRLKPQVHT